MAKQRVDPQEPGRKGTAGQPGVLIVDDDSGINEHVSELLTKAGFKVYCAVDAEQGLTLVRSTIPRVVLLDIFLPGKDGLEMLLEVREEFPKMKVVVISGKQRLLTGSNMELARMLGADDTLAKPFTGEELVRSINKLLAAE